MVETSRVYMRRLAAQQRRMATSRLQASLRTKKKHPPRKLTPEELKNRREKRKENQQDADEKIARAKDAIWEVCEGLATDLGKTPAHWQRFLMQLLRLAASERKTSRWNAFISLFLERLNAGK